MKKRKREEKIKQARRLEYQERQKRLIEEQRIETARVKRQKLIEEARLKDQLERTEKLKELQEKTVITQKKDSPKDLNPGTRENLLEEKRVLTSSDFDTEELFENTKIVPNTSSVNQKKPVRNSTWQEDSLDKPLTEREDSSLTSDAVFSVSDSKKDPSVIDLFKEEAAKRKVVEVSDEEEDVPTSIYDILERNKNIMWKKTDTDSSKDTIPVIGNNNLRPEVLEEKNVSEIKFPDIENKGGEILWKETL